ncbi:putative ADP-ribosylation factor GTPase-activating protein AGD14 [Vitis vinifera]|uniref:Putative ADP-ribosylation factor GTPase-activating protein AGD14 n=1 Tax=Vitis vinifera TaxID=29760 RepID=A0A438KE52_VITVI|nr:putative ADP-ribosylation factor GTPase-activating protein AGD14 [Vitis vinifera]
MYQLQQFGATIRLHNFLTFVCTNCSGIHREFTHRIKSVSMAKFTTEEVTALQAGGMSNLHKLREFIKHVYVDRKYTGERNVDKLPMVKVGNSGSRNSSLEVACEWRNSERSSPSGRSGDNSIRYYYDERRSPRFSHEHSRSGGFRRNPVRFEVVDDRVRDDRLGGGRRTESNRFSNGESRQISRLPDSQRKVDVSSSPEVRPVSNILGENVSPLHAGELPNTNDKKDANASAHPKKIASSSSIGSIDRNLTEPKMANSGSLIDLSSNPGPADAAAVSQTQPAPSSTDIGNLASGEVSSKNKASDSPSTNFLESLLSELSVPAVVPGGNISEGLSSGNMLTTHIVGVSSTSPPVNMLELPNNSGASISTSMINKSMLIPSEGAPAASQVGKMPMLAGDSGDFIDEVPEQLQLRDMQKCSPSASPSAASSSTSQQTSQLGGILCGQPQTSSFLSNTRGPFSTSEKSSQSVSELGQGISSPVGSQPPLMEAKPSGRKELPADLFTATYSPTPSPFQVGKLVHLMAWDLGCSIILLQCLSQLCKITNPFDFNDETTQVQAPVYKLQFPSMASLQGALPSVSAPVGISHASSLGVLPQMMQPQSPSHVSTMPPQSPYALALSTSPYARPQVPHTMLPSRHQGIGSITSNAAVFGSAIQIRLPAGRYSVPSTPDSHSFSSLGETHLGRFKKMRWFCLLHHGKKIGCRTRRSIYTFIRIFSAWYELVVLVLFKNDL